MPFQHIFFIGANRGTGYGYNELYLTRKNGSLQKIRRHALQRFPGARTRHTAVLKGANNTELVFISASYGARADGKINKHALFRKNGVPNKRRGSRYFNHIRGPWQRHTNSSCVLAADVNGDGLDDIVLCNEKIPALYFEQRANGSFKKSSWTENTTRNWRNARIADLDGDGLPELAAV